MTKKQELELDRSTLRRTGDYEPIFVVRARDILAPHTVLDWADRAEGIGVLADKVESARKVAQDMLTWQRQNAVTKPD